MKLNLFTFFLISILEMQIMVAQESGEEVGKDNSSSISRLEVSPDGKNFITGSRDGIIKLWDITLGKEIKTYKGHTSPIFTLSYSPDGRTIISGSRDGLIKLWDVSTGTLIKTIDVESAVVDAKLMPDGKTIMSADFNYKVKRWDIESAREINSIRFSNYTTIDFSKDGNNVILSRFYGNTIYLQIFDSMVKDLILSFEDIKSPISLLSCSPDENFIAGVAGDSTLKVWNIHKEKSIKEFVQSLCIKSVTFSPDAKFILLGFEDGTIKLLNVESGEEAKKFVGHSGQINSVKFLHDGKYILSCSNDNTIKLWDVATGKEIKTFQ